MTDEIEDIEETAEDPRLEDLRAIMQQLLLNAENYAAALGLIGKPLRNPRDHRALLAESLADAALYLVDSVADALASEEDIEAEPE